jgi:hypothetical protein
LRPLAEGTDPRVPSFANAYLSVLPLFSIDGVPSFLAPPKIMHIDEHGVASNFYVFTGDPASYTTGFFQANVTVGAPVRRRRGSRPGPMSRGRCRGGKSEPSERKRV